MGHNKDILACAPKTCVNVQCILCVCVYELVKLRKWVRNFMREEIAEEIVGLFEFDAECDEKLERMFVNITQLLVGL